MKLKDLFAIEEVDDKLYMVCLDSSILIGMIQLNETAGLIVNCLAEETTEEQIADKLASVYEVSIEEALTGVHQIIEQLRSIHAIEE